MLCHRQHHRRTAALAKSRGSGLRETLEAEGTLAEYKGITGTRGDLAKRQ